MSRRAQPCSLIVGMVLAGSVGTTLPLLSLSHITPVFRTARSMSMDARNEQCVCRRGRIGLWRLGNVLRGNALRGLESFLGRVAGRGGYCLWAFTTYTAAV